MTIKVIQEHKMYDITYRIIKYLFFCFITLNAMIITMYYEMWILFMISIFLFIFLLYKFYKSDKYDG